MTLPWSPNPRPGGADIFEGPIAHADLLAEAYDLEHDEVTEDLLFYRELTRRVRGAVLDLGCGSGRLIGTFLDGGASRVVAVDGSPAMLRRARRRIRDDPGLATAEVDGRIELVETDVRAVRRKDRFALIVAAGVVPHLDGPDEGLRLLSRMAHLLSPTGLAVIDDLGPGALPSADLPLAIDWHKPSGDREFVRRSELVRREAPEGLRVGFATILDVTQPDGTKVRLPASYRLWYPSPAVLGGLVEAAGLVVAAVYGSHDLDPYGDRSERSIVIARRRRSRPARGLVRTKGAGEQAW